MSHYHLLLFFGIILFSPIIFSEIFAYVDDKGNIIIEKKHTPPFNWHTYDRENLPGWEFFEGMVPDNSSANAYTTTQVDYDYSLFSPNEKDCKFTFLVDSTKTQAYINKELSWVKSDKKTKELLNHEHGHAYVALIYSQKLALKLDDMEEKVFKCSNDENSSKEKRVQFALDHILNEVTTPIFLQQNFTNENYDDDVEDLSIQQDRWNKIFLAMLANPELDLVHAKSLIPLPQIIQIGGSRTFCGFLYFADNCEISNTSQLIYDIITSFIIGGVIASGFFLWQWNNRAKRRMHGQASFVAGLYFLKEKIKKQKSNVEKNYNNQMRSDEVEKEHGWLKNTPQYLRFAMGISHDTMDTSIIKAVEMICTFAELPPLTGNKEIDLEHCDKIDGMIDNLFNSDLKKAKKIFDEEKKEQLQTAIEEIGQNKSKLSVLFKRIFRIKV